MENAVAVVKRPRGLQSEEALLGTRIAELQRKLGGEEGSAEVPDTSWPPIAMPSVAEAQLLAEVRSLLEAVAASLGGGKCEQASMVGAVIDSGHLTARTEMLLGDAERLQQLVPELVQLVALTVSGPPEAERLAAQAAAHLGTGTAQLSPDMPDRSVST